MWIKLWGRVEHYEYLHFFFFCFLGQGFIYMWEKIQLSQLPYSCFFLCAKVSYILHQICKEHIFPSIFEQLFTSQKWNFKMLITIEHKVGLYFWKFWNPLITLCSTIVHWGAQICIKYAKNIFSPQYLNSCSPARSGILKCWSQLSIK